MFHFKCFRVFAFFFCLLISLINPAEAKSTKNPGEPPNPPKDPCEGSATCGSEASLKNGNLSLDYRLPSYRSLGIAHQLRFVYNSATADVRPIIEQDSTVIPGPLTTISGRLMVNGRVISFPQGNEIFYGGGLQSETSVRLALRFPANNLSTGLHSYAFSVSQNSANRSLGE